MVIGMLVGLVKRMLPGAVMGYYLVASTTVAQLIAALTRLHAPKAVVIPLAVTFRFFPVVISEATAVCEAMRMRGVIRRAPLFRKPWVFLECLLVPLLVSTLKTGEELSAAVLTRGLGSPVSQACFYNVGFGPWDVVFIVIIAAALTRPVWS